MPAATDPLRLPSLGELRAVGTGAGLDVVEVTTAAPFDEVRTTLERRKADGLHAGMSFTYRNPARSTEPTRSLPGASALVVGALGYLTDEPVQPDPRLAGEPVARIARYAWDDHYALLRKGLRAMADTLESAGWRTRVLADDNALVDRAAAQRAGIGWWGKNANLLLPGRGSWYVLGSVLTDAPLAGDAPVVADGCGSCTRCISGCPTGAITAPGVVDARRCLSWLLQAEGVFPPEHRVALGDRIYGCDECQEVCPPNRRMTSRPALETSRPWAPLLELLDDDDATVLRWAELWYIPRRDLRHVRRNALIVLGNVGDPGDQAVIDVVMRYLGHPDGMLRSHAVWSARRLGREDLVTPLAADPDPLVVAEMRTAVVPRPLGDEPLG